MIVLEKDFALKEFVFVKKAIMGLTVLSLKLIGRLDAKIIVLDKEIVFLVSVIATQDSMVLIARKLQHSYVQVMAYALFMVDVEMENVNAILVSKERLVMK